jgi:hypothetical protein
MKISESAIELGFEDEFWDNRGSVFINGLSVSSSLCTMKISESAIELGFEDEFWDSRDSVS